MKKSLSFLLAASILASSAVLTACNNNGDNMSSTSEPSSESSVESSILVETKEESGTLSSEQKTELEEILQTYSEKPIFTPSTSAISSAEIAEEKQIMLITDSVQDEYSRVVSDTFIAAAKKAGFKTVVSYDTDGTDAVYIQAFDEVVEKNYNCVALFGDIDKDKIGSEIEIVQSHGIPVFSAGNSHDNDKEHYVDGSMGWDYIKAGSLLLDWVSYHQDGKVNALVITCGDNDTSNYAFQGFAEDFSKYVKQGYCTELKAKSSEIGDTLKNKIATALQKDSNINCVIVMDEDMISDTSNALKANNNNKKINFVALGGSPESFSNLENGNLDMLIAQSYEASAYALVDYCLRGLTEEGIPQSENLPMRIFTPDTVEEETIKQDDNEEAEGTARFYLYAFGSIFSDGYKSLWGIEE